MPELHGHTAECMDRGTVPLPCNCSLDPSCPAHRTGLKVTVTERHDGLECGHPGCTYQPGHLGAHSNEEEARDA
jgi:hypothetical protein